ncbi:hypothetical protein [Nocardia amikacinitolerans]|nr:hypothetical protein [Nocardia amikacinitolerans]
MSLTAVIASSTSPTTITGAGIAAVTPAPGSRHVSIAAIAAR